MIKIKLLDYDKGRNSHTFRPLLMYAHYFNEIGVQFVSEGSYDIEFIGMHNFLNKKIPLDKSIEMGIQYLKNKTGDYCLFDGSDSTSLMGSYEVLKNSNAKYLFKTAITTKKQYNTPSAFNKWFFGTGSSLDLSYDIPEDDFNKIKLTGWNLGYYHPEYLNFDPIIKNKNIDVCAIYQGHHNENYDHDVRNDVYYTNHRTSAWNVLSNISNITYEINKRPYEEFIHIMKSSKCTLSPYGMGEICFRDFEIFRFGSLMIKPDMSLVNTYPNVYIPYETYIPCKLDWSDLEEKIEWINNHPRDCMDIIQNSRKIMAELYTVEKLLLYWYNILKTFDSIS